MVECIICAKCQLDCLNVVTIERCRCLGAWNVGPAKPWCRLPSETWIQSEDEINFRFLDVPNGKD